MLKKIVIKGAKEHNLKNVSLEIPKEKLVVITGLSGSGKSSLAFDTIYAYIVSKAKDDLPDPDKPVITTNFSFGISKETFFRLCSFAPFITIFFNIFFFLNQ